MVGLSASKQNYVELATSSNASRLVGIVSNSPLLELGNANQIKTVVSGQTSALVSDLNGPIRVGDHITASPVEGVGMKAIESVQVVGVAESNLGKNGETTHTITDKNGKKKQIHIGTVDVQVNVAFYNAPQSTVSAIVPTFLLNAGSAIAGKDVSPIRILLSFSCLLIGFIVAGIILQSAVRAGVISLGRNPLAHRILRQGLLDVLFTTLGVLVIVIVAFYLILTL